MLIFLDIDPILKYIIFNKMRFMENMNMSFISLLKNITTCHLSPYQCWAKSHGQCQRSGVVPFGSGSLRESGGNRRGFRLGGRRIQVKASKE